MSHLRILGELYARPSFMEGMARNLDILNTLREYNESSTETEADIKALMNDWRTTGDDIRSSISSYEREFSSAA